MRTFHVLTVLLVASVASTAVADPGTNDNDAGSGADAGDVQQSALFVEYGRLYGGRVRGSDVDWYQAHVGSSAVTCVRLTANSTSHAYFALGQQNADGSMSAPILVGEGTRAMGGIAGLPPLATSLRVARAPDGGGPGHYEFRLDRVGATSDSDGGVTDAGTGADAVPVAPGCVQGRLSGIQDAGDAFRLTVGPGEVVTYSYAAAAPGSTLSLLNAAGQALGPVLESGQRAEVRVPTAGTYFLSAQRSAGSIGEVGYVVGAIVGPEPTGCRPYCMG